MKYLFIVFGIFCSGFAIAQQNSTYRIDHDNIGVKKSEDVGVGIKVGSFTGFSGKYWLDEVHAVDASLAFFQGNTEISASYLWHFREAFADGFAIPNPEDFVPYIGVGFISGYGSNTQYFNRSDNGFGFTARLPFGVEFLPKKIKIGAFVELAMDLGLAPNTSTFLTADLGARYYF